jgi:hypothetical protein
MSDARDLPPPPPARSGGQPLVTFLLIAAGVILIFPGVCSLAAIIILSGIDPQGVFNEGGLVLLWVACFALAIGGVLLIRFAIRRNRNRNRG